MNTTKKVAIVVTSVAVLVGLWMIYVWFALGNDSQSDTSDPGADVTNFEECAGAGNPIMDSYPRQCSSDGEVFVEDVELPDDDIADSIYSSESGEELVVNVGRTQAISSPFSFGGEVPGNWSFEADFPIEVWDANQQVVAESYAQLQADWMTEEYVPFEANIEFSSPASDSGYLVLYKANPSGLAENADKLTIPITFAR